MAGLDPAIHEAARHRPDFQHVFAASRFIMDARVEPAHDGE